MTCPKSRKKKLITVSLLFLLVQSVNCAENNIETKDDVVKHVPTKNNSSDKTIQTGNVTKNDKKSEQPEITPLITENDNNPKKVSEETPKKKIVPNDKSQITTEPPYKQKEGNAATLNSGALIRGFGVFVGLSVLVVAYIVFRSLRLDKTRAQMVRKYGVLAHRQDVEMRPLPLDEEDDEDTTVFDASNVITNNAQHQVS